MTTHSSTLLWKIPWTEKSDRLHSPWGCKELDTTERLHSLTVFSISSMPSNFSFCGMFMDIMNKMLLRVWILYYSKEYWFLLVFFSRHLTQMNSNSSLWNLNLVLYLMLLLLLLSRSVVSDSVRPQRQQPTRLPHLWDSPGKNTGVGCHFLLQCMKVKS